MDRAATTTPNESEYREFHSHYVPNDREAEDEQEHSAAGQPRDFAEESTSIDPHRPGGQRPTQ